MADLAVRIELLEAQVAIYNLLIPRLLGRIGGDEAAFIIASSRTWAEARLAPGSEANERDQLEATMALRFVAEIEEALAKTGYSKKL